MQRSGQRIPVLPLFVLKSSVGGERAQERISQYTCPLPRISLTDNKLAQLKSSLFGGTLTFRNGQIGQWHMTYNNQNKALSNLYSVKRQPPWVTLRI